MKYTNGNYECLARPRKPLNVENKKAYIIGGGLAGLAAAKFLIRDAYMDPKNITIFEKESILGGGCDGKMVHEHVYLCRGGREMEDHFECLWDLFSSVPSVEFEGQSVLDEYYYLDHDSPVSSPMRVTEKQGKNAHVLHKYTLSDKALLELSNLVLTPEEGLANKRINDVFSEDFFKSNFWCLWRTMFAFEEWHSAIEMRRYLTRFIHHTQDISDLSCLKFGRYNTYDSFILPLSEDLKKLGVNFVNSTTVDNVIFDIKNSKKVAKEILLNQNGINKTLKLTEDDLVFITLGSNTEESTLGDNDTPAVMSKNIGASWKLWDNIAAQCSEFGNPMVFHGKTKESNWESATVTCFDDVIPNIIKKQIGRSCDSGKIVTGGPITQRDSSWLISWTVSRQPHFKAQKPGEIVLWLYGLFSDVKGDYIKKTMEECTGREIVQEWLYHMGVDSSKIEEVSKHCNVIPCMMPYCTSYFMNRKVEDRPKIVPNNAVNFAFIGEHVETPRDCVFTTEFAVRTGMEAVYSLIDIERGVPEVFGSIFDVRCLLKTGHELMEGRKLTDLQLPFIEKVGLKVALKKLKGTEIEKMLKENKLI